MITIRSLLAEARDALSTGETPYLDALVLLEWATHRDRGYLLAEQNEEAEELLGARCIDLFRGVVGRRRSGEPVAYITGHREFYDMDFTVGPGALVPRPDSEVLVDRSVEILRETASGEASPTLSVHDCCTGTGCIGISVVATFSREYKENIRLVLSDIDEIALSWCRRNVHSLGHRLGPHTEVVIVQADLVTSNNAVDLITANPPYLTRDETQSVLSAGWGEPEIALSAGADGLEAINKLVPQAFSHLRPGGYLVMEHGNTQADAVRELCRQNGFESVQTGRDLADNERYVEARKPVG